MKRNKPKKKKLLANDKRTLAVIIIWVLALIAVIAVGAAWTVMEFMVRWKFLFG